MSTKQSQSRIPKSQSKIPRSRRSSSSSRISGRYSSLDPPRPLVRSKSTLSETPVTKTREMNPKQLYPPPTFSECSDRLVPSPKSVRKQLSSNTERSKNIDTRPFSDKRWQQFELQKVQQYLQREKLERKDVNFDGYSLRPISINTFIEMCNLLFTKLDSKLVITKENYVEELPFILQSLGYPSSQNLKKSLMKAVNIPRNWPMAIGILGWIVELVETLNCFDHEALIPEKQKIVANTILDTFATWVHNAESTVQIPLDQIYEQLLKSENLTANEFNDVKQEIDDLETVLKNLCHEKTKLMEAKSVYANKKDQIKSIEEKISEDKELQQQLINKIKQLQREVDEQEYNTGNSIKEKENLLKKIEQQCVGKEEYSTMKNNCTELEKEIVSLNKLIDNLKECKYSEELKLERNRDRIIELSEEFNKRCLSNITELNSFAVYDITLMNPNTPQVLSELKAKMVKTWEAQLEESAKLELKMIKFADLNTKMEQLSMFELQDLPARKNEIEMLKEKRDQAKKTIQNCQIEIEKHIKRKEDLQLKIDHIEKTQETMIAESKKVFELQEKQYFEYGQAAAKYIDEIYNQLDEAVEDLKALLPDKHNRK